MNDAKEQDRWKTHDWGVNRTVVGMENDDGTTQLVMRNDGFISRGFWKMQPNGRTMFAEGAGRTQWIGKHGNVGGTRI